MATSKLALLESRVEILEAEIARMKTSFQATAQTDDWIDQIYGLFADYPDFDKVTELGKKYRDSLRPKVAKRKFLKSAKNGKH